MFLRFLLLALGSFTNAHHMLTNVIINSTNLGPGVCVRIPPDTDPVTNVSSPNMACNINGEKPLNKFCDVDAGANVTLQWRTWPDGSKNTPIDVSHQGPCAAYMKRIASFAENPAQRGGWFKIWQDGYKDGEFCTERLRKNEGKMSVTIPKDLEGGQYLLRAEQLALHQAKDKGGAQWYIGCVQIVVYSTGGSARPPGVSIPGYVSATDAGVLYDYWKNMHPTSYLIPGPTPYIPTSAGGGQRIFVEYPKKYTECIFSNADWCSTKLPSFSDEDTCWIAASNCWKQLEDCYAMAPATGHTGCTQWEKQCNSYRSYCANCGVARTCAGPFPKKRSIDVLFTPIPNTVQKRHTHEHLRRFTPTPDDTLTRARSLCDEIAKVCKKNVRGGVCGIFRAACRSAVNPRVLAQFPEKGSRKWQALWLYQVVCENEGFQKDECRQRFSKAVEGFE